MRLFTLIALTLALAAISAAQTPVAIEKEFLGYIDNITKFGTYGGTADEDKLTKFNDLLRDKLLAYGKRADVLAYSFPKIKQELYVATSPDGRFRVYSWDLNDGGSMHDFDKVYQYQGRSGKIYTIGSKPSEDHG